MSQRIFSHIDTERDRWGLTRPRLRHIVIHAVTDTTVTYTVYQRGYDTSNQTPATISRDCFVTFFWNSLVASAKVEVREEQSQ